MLEAAAPLLTSPIALFETALAGAPKKTHVVSLLYKGDDFVHTDLA